jgi:hypothetical protein
MVVASAASFYAHVFFDKAYHVEGSRLERFAWFKRKQELHFVHHRPMTTVELASYREILVMTGVRRQRLELAI